MCKFMLKYTSKNTLFQSYLDNFKASLHIFFWDLAPCSLVEIVFSEMLTASIKK